MSWQDAKAAAEAIAEKLPLNMKGKTLQVVDFDTEEDCRAFYPWSLGFHRMILSAIRKIAWKRGTKLIIPVVLQATPRFLSLAPSERISLANRLFTTTDVHP